jgi:hypothetical protein
VSNISWKQAKISKFKTTVIFSNPKMAHKKALISYNRPLKKYPSREGIPFKDARSKTG